MRILAGWNKALAAAVALVLTAACGKLDRTAYSHFEDIGGNGWDPAYVICFEPWPADSAEVSAERYDMELVTRSTMRKPLTRLPLAVTIEDADGTLRSDTIVIGDPKGPEMRLKERYGVRECTITLDENVRLTDGYSVSLSPLCEPSATSGLINVGIMLTRRDTRQSRRTP